jgi:predicted ATPase
MIASPSGPFLRRVRLKHYKSVTACDVSLGPLTFLVGPNGAGKSTFLDALRLVSDSLRTSLDHALRDRGGINEVRQRSGGHPKHFGIGLDFYLPDGAPGTFAFEVGAKAGGGYVVKREECRIKDSHYLVREGQILEGPDEVSPPASDDRLYLVNAAGFPRFRPLYDLLSGMGFYNLNPREIRALQQPDKGEILDREGRNAASVLDRMEKHDPGVKRRIEEYLALVVPGIEGVDSLSVGHMETLEFRQRVPGAKDPWRFPAIDMSDGTLRALGILIALFQGQASRLVPLVAIEEPEVALHPAASGALRDCLREGSSYSQILVTSHSPELLDDPNIPVESILAVAAVGGESRISGVDEAGRSALRDRLFTAGELMRADQLHPDPSDLARTRQLRLFESDG